MPSDEGEVRGLARYGALFARDHAAALFAWGIVARLPLGMAALSLVLLVRGQGGDYGRAGLVAAVYGIAVAVGAPYGGRQVDRRGPATILRRRTVIYPALFGLVAVLAEVGAPLAVIAAVAAAAGLTLAPVGSVLRTIWPVVAGDAASTAYALDAALQEAIWVGGPLLVALLAAIDPVAAVAGTAVTAAAGTLLFARIPPVGAVRPSGHRHGSRLGALSAVGVRTVTILALFVGVGFGAVEIAVPAFADLHGNRALAGVGLAGFAAGSLVGGLLAGLFPLHDERRRIIAGTFALAALMAVPLASTSIPTLTALLFLAGLPIAPLVAGVYGMLGRVAADGSTAEAFSWLGTAIAVGIAVGTVGGGIAIDGHGWRWSILLAVCSVTVGALVVLLRRHTLAPPRPR